MTQETLEAAKRIASTYSATQIAGNPNTYNLAAAVVDLEAALREAKQHVRHVYGCPASGGVMYTNFGPCQCGATEAMVRIDDVLPKPVCQTCNGVGYTLHGGDFGVSESSPCPDCIDAREIMEAAHD